MDYETVLRALNDSRFKANLLKTRNLSDQSFNDIVNEIISDCNILDDTEVDVNVV